MDGGAWWATVHGVAKGRTRLSDLTSLLLLPKPFPFIREFVEKMEIWSSSSQVVCEDSCSLPSEVAELLFGRSVAQSSDSLRPHGLQHIRFLCPSSSPGAYSNSRPLSRWCHPTISSSVVPFSSSLQSFPASGSFPMSWLFASGSQNIGASASASVFLWVVEYRPIFFCFFLLTFTVRPRRASACWNLRSKSLDVFSGSKLSHFSWNNVHVSETQSPPFQRQNNRSLKQGFMLAQVMKLKLVQGQEHPHLYREIWAPGVQERRHNFKSVLKISPVTKIVT